MAPVVVEYIYVLQCSQEKWYIGTAVNYNFDARIKLHEQGKGCEWTIKYPMVKLVEKLQVLHEQDLQNWTMYYMARYGASNVRGWIHTEPDLSASAIQTLDATLQNDVFRYICHRCHRLGHIATDCHCQVCFRHGHVAKYCPVSWAILKVA